MDKKEILELSQKENAYLDEMQRSDVIKSFGVGGVAVAILCVVFSVIKIFQKQTFIEYGVILFGYLSAANLYSYIKTKKETLLIGGVACAITAITAFIAYFLV